MSTDKGEEPVKASKQQPPSKRAGFGAAAVVGIALAIIKPWEGLSLRTYHDIVGIATVCYGQTGPQAHAQAVYTKAECEEMLGAEVSHFAAAMERCISKGVMMTPLQQAVVLSWSYNVGSAGACGSTLVKRLNAGHPPATWCRELLKWDKVRKDGKLIRSQGLANRRQNEYAHCLES